MRIIAGQWRGRKLVAPPGDATRPTADRTRETLFSMLISRLGSFEGLRVADLFAGSGALGIEALSRGAAQCLFVEQDAVALKTIRANLAQFDLKCDVRAGSVMGISASTSRADLILLDPPYYSGAGAVALDKLLRIGWIGAGAWISLETAFDESTEIKGLELDASRKVGKAKISLFRYAPVIG